MKKISISIISVIILIQFIPVNRDNPQTIQEEEIVLIGEIETVIKNSCYDCHSNNTVWPWYSNVAPVSWIVASHVHDAREELNFSEWNRYSKKRMDYKLKEIVEEVEEEEMPLFSYLLAHDEASLSDKERELLISWARNFNTTEIDTTMTETKTP